MVVEFLVGGVFGRVGVGVAAFALPPGHDFGPGQSEPPEESESYDCEDDEHGDEDAEVGAGVVVAFVVEVDGGGGWLKWVWWHLASFVCQIGLDFGKVGWMLIRLSRRDAPCGDVNDYEFEGVDKWG